MSLFAEWSGAATTRPPSGAHEFQDLPSGKPVTLLGSVLGGDHPGRRDAEEITVFKSTGHAALDVAAAHVAYSVATARGWGIRVER
ncbi:hypothetical protein ACGFYP_04135 [Streptomyces sp. NPDC048370]|uniref:hypothetical protein n=1 Tax=Streptomyces sp. NPDC048370 TaxID=3365540 RepID=UPI00371161DE